MKTKHRRITILTLAVLLLTGTALPLILPTTAAEDTVYLGNRQDLFITRESLDDFGWNTAHSGERITIGSKSFDTGLGFHCLPDRDAYVEFDISSLNMKYFVASVGVLKEASYFLEWGSISFHVYGDGQLLASTPMVVWGDEPYLLSCSVEGVHTLRLVQNNENGHACDAGVWGDARLTNVKPQEESGEIETVFDPDKTREPQPSDMVSGDYAYVSDLYWLDSKTYSGNIVGRDCNTANEIIFSNDGKFFEKGVGFHASSGDYTSYVDINIEGLGFTKFAAYYGVCETLTSHDISMASVKFAIFGDDVKLWESDTMKFGEAMKPMDCDITGVKTLRIAVAGAPGISGAWGTWGGAVISKSGEITDDMLYSDFSFTPETDTSEAETSAPETNAPETNAPETNIPNSETTTDIPETDFQTNVPDETDMASETGSSDEGCGSSIGIASAGIVLTVCATLIFKKKED